MTMDVQIPLVINFQRLDSVSGQCKMVTVQHAARGDSDLMCYALSTRFGCRIGIIQIETCMIRQGVVRNGRGVHIMPTVGLLVSVWVHLISGRGPGHSS